jgi:YbbR domain-containing protein
MNYFLGRNLVPKLLAVLVALVIWVFVMNEQNPPLEGTFQVALSSRNLTEDMLVVEAPTTVRVKVRGLRNAIAGASGKDFKATVDVKGLAAGQYNLPISVVAPSGYEVVEVIPDKAAIKLDAVRSRRFRIEARLSGPMVGEMVLGQVEINPDSVMITGPQSQLDIVEKVVAPVEIRGRTPAFSQDARLVLLNAEGNEIKNLKVEPSKVAVVGNLEPGSVSRQVEVKTVLSGNLPTGVLLRRVFTEPAKIEIKGPKEIVDPISAVSTAPISLEGITKDVTREIPLQLQPGLTVLKKTVMVRITVGQGP